MSEKRYSIAEFFSGCGGTSRGFTKSGRFNVVFGNDVKAEALQTFEFNHHMDDTPPLTIKKDIRLLEINDINNSLKERGILEGDLDCMIGGPPCQGFSQLRRSEMLQDGKIVKFSGYSQLAHDPRNDLVLRYLEVAEALKPKFLVIENVPQMLNHGFDGRLGKLSETVINILERDLGYNVEVAVLNCADYGVPQLRERAVFIASSIGNASMPPKTHTSPQHQKLLSQGVKPWVTVEQAISDLPPPPINNGDTFGGSSIKNYQGLENEYTHLMRSRTNFPYNHITRNYRKSVLDTIKEMRPGQTWDTESHRMQTKYNRMAKKYALSNGVSNEEALQELLILEKINPVFYKDYYWSAYSRLAWDHPALTITANANFLGSGRFSHPEKNRGITMREAARLQSFDDDFRFITSNTGDLDGTRIGVGIDMIGEAVPPLLSKAIALHLAAQLDNY